MNENNLKKILSLLKDYLSTKLDGKLDNSVTNLGNMSNKTITDLQDALLAWVKLNYNKPNARASFVGNLGSISELWNNNNTTSLIPAGTTITVEIDTYYFTSNYVLLKFTTYDTKMIYYAVLSNNVWQNIYKVAFDEKTNFGDMRDKTIPELQSVLINWVKSNHNKPNAIARFDGDISNMVTFWNNNNTTDKIGAGAVITVEIDSYYTGNDYVLLKLTQYGSKRVYYVALSSNVWQNIYKVAFDDDIKNVNTKIDGKVPTTRKVNGKALSGDITLSASDVGADASGSASTALTNANKYTDASISTEVSNRNTAISNHNTATTAHNDIRTLITNLTTRLNTLANSDDTTLDQMKEVVAYIKANRELIESVTTDKVNVTDIINNLTTNVTNKPLSAAQGVELKALIDDIWEALDSQETVASLSAHIGNSTIHVTSTDKTNWNAAKTHADSAHAPSNAEKNQNAFSNVKVGTTTVAADSVTDTLELAGSNVTITPDATNDKITIGITKANVTNALGYTPPTTNTTYGVATSSVLGLVKSGTDITVDSNGNVSVNDDSHNHVISNVDGLQSALDGKLPLTGGNVTGDIVLKTNSSGDSPALVFERGSTSDTYTDWKITDVGGALKFDVRTGGANFTNKITFSESGDITANSFKGSLVGNAASATQAYSLYSGTAFPNGQTDKTYVLVAEYKNCRTVDFNTKLVLFISNYFGTQRSGILEITCRITNGNVPDFLHNKWSVCNGINNFDHFIATWFYDENTQYVTLRLYMKVKNWETSYNVVKLSEHNWGHAENNWILYEDSNNKFEAIPSNETQVISSLLTLSNNAASATKLDSSAGSATQPVYFSGGKPVACTYTLGKSVPSDAVFTDTTYTLSSITGTLAIAKGGTGATTVADAIKNFFNTAIATPGYLLTLPSSGWQGGYTSIAQLKTTLGLGSAAYTASTAYATASHTHNYAGSSSAGGSANSSLVLTSDGSMKLYAESNNEINFGGSNNSTTIYFGYKAKDSKAVPANFVFGGSSGSATVTATTFKGNLNGNATSATNVLISVGDVDAERSIVVHNGATSGQNLFTVSGVTANYSKGTLTASGGFKFGSNATMQYNSTTKSIDFVFA